MAFSSPFLSSLFSLSLTTRLSSSQRLSWGVNVVSPMAKLIAKAPSSRSSSFGYLSTVIWKLSLTTFHRYLVSFHVFLLLSLSKLLVCLVFPLYGHWREWHLPTHVQITYWRFMGPQNINNYLFDDVVVMAWKLKYMKHAQGRRTHFLYTSPLQK